MAQRNMRYVTFAACPAFEGSLRNDINPSEFKAMRRHSIHYSAFSHEPGDCCVTTKLGSLSDRFDRRQRVRRYATFEDHFGLDASPRNGRLQRWDYRGSGQAAFRLRHAAPSFIIVT
jgi:hypothetical protein